MYHDGWCLVVVQPCRGTVLPLVSLRCMGRSETFVPEADDNESLSAIDGGMMLLSGCSACESFRRNL